MHDEEIRDPDAILARISEREAARQSGRLKVFFGAVAGVGKTYSMLQAARTVAAGGTDVIVGCIETHGRKETEALLHGLEIQPAKQIYYKGKELSLFDLDRALERRPQLILVDELAYSNPPGSRHEKRWQDVQELLDARIDVFTTLNVQHLESINDIVRQITGIAVRERVPDSFLEQAMDIELVDLPPDELLHRLNEGKVYVPEHAKQAMDNFFRKGNLLALRELALRFVAERVDAQMEDYRKYHSIKHPWPANERILVCVSQSPLSAKLVRAARRMSSSLRAPWIVAYVEPQSSRVIRDADKSQIIETLRLAERLGAQTVELTGKNISDEIIRCATHYNVTKIIVGKPTGPIWRDRFINNIVDDVIRKSGPIDVHVITGEESLPKTALIPYIKAKSRWHNYSRAIGILLVCTIAARVMLPFFDLSNIVMAYILGVVVVATKLGRGPSILSSILSVAAFDFFFVPPYHTFVVADTQYLVTFAVMLVIALVISTLTSQVRDQADAARLRETRTAALYSMSKELATKMEIDEIIEIGMQHVGEVFDSKVGFYGPDPATGKIQFKASSRSPIDEDLGDTAVAEWVHRNQQLAGLNTATLPAAKALYVPLRVGNSSYGALAVCPSNPDLLKSPEQLRLLETFVNQAAFAYERAILSQEAESNRLRVKTEQLRNSLLSSVSHDLRTPLATITGAASSIMNSDIDLEIEAIRELGNEIYKESVRLNKLVSNLLEMTKVESGTLILKRDLLPAEELIGSALGAVDLQGCTIDTYLNENIPLVYADAILLQQVLVNLLENAVKYAPLSSIKIHVYQDSPEAVTFEVTDSGRGIPADRRKLVFEKFYRENPYSGSGAGLGLAICQGIIEAHGGRIWVEEAPEGTGASFKFNLPTIDKQTRTTVTHGD